MKKKLVKTSRFVLRWGIAVGGIWWVVSQMYLRDHVLILNDHHRLEEAALVRPAEENSASFLIVDPQTKKEREVPANQVYSAPDQKTLEMKTDTGNQKMHLLGMRLAGDINHNPKVVELLVAENDHADGKSISPSQVAGGYQLKVPHPRIEIGLISMVHQAKAWLLLLALLVFPTVFFLTSYRWNELLKALEIDLSQWSTFVLTMVGCFYSTFMPGVTGGDVLKAYYASKHTLHRTRAVMSVLIDRVIGLLGLVVVGGVMAAYTYISSANHADPVARICMKIAMASVTILAGSVVALFLLFHPHVRKYLGMDVILRRLPMQQQVQHIIEVMEIYRKRPWLVLGALVITLPVHIAVATSAMLAGMAFGLPISAGYYYVAVPVIILAASVPISPQGAGVMEFFAIKLTEKQGATVGQAFALAMCIRLTGIFWNLAGGLFMLRGGYRGPSADEAKALEEDEVGDRETEALPPSDIRNSD